MTDTPQTTAGADPKEARVLEQHLDPSYDFSEFDPATPAQEDGADSASNSGDRQMPESDRKSVV